MMGGSQPRLLTRAPRLDGLLQRRRLLELASTSAVVTISGPEGSGTTTLAAQLAAAGDTTVAWCRLAPGFDRLDDVVQMIATATNAEVEPSNRVIDAAERVLDLLDTTPTTVVIDDYHLAANADIDRLIAECVDLMPDTARFVVAGAARPAGLIGLVSARHRTDIDASDLAFDVDEATALFALHDGAPERAAQWFEALHGWARGIAAGAFSPTAAPEAFVDDLVAKLIDLTPNAASITNAAAVLPYVTPRILMALGIQVTEEELAMLVASSPLIVDHGGFARLSPDAATRVSAAIDPNSTQSMRRQAASAITDHDPTTAIDLLIDAGEHTAAADILDEHLSHIGVERALTWLYRLPPDIRRRFPPVLAAGQATVEVDVALASAQLKVETALTEQSRREALFALGSIEAHRGELAPAATAFEAALRAARGDETSVARIAIELAATRFLLGDTLGARSTLIDVEPTPVTRHLICQIDVVEGTTTGASSPFDADDPFDTATAALYALVGGDVGEADAQSERAYRIAVELGGEPLLAAAVARGWALLRAHDHSAAELVVDEMERRLGPRHQLSRVHGAMLRAEISRASGDRSHLERNIRRVRDLRQLGYASIETLASVLGSQNDDASSESLVVSVMGEHRVIVDGREIRRSDWKSKKALEVLTVLAAEAPRGARREQLIEAVWPGRTPDKGRTLLRTALSEIRRVLEPGRPAGEPSSHVSTNEDVISLAGQLDLDLLDARLDAEPVATFHALRRGLASEVQTAEWAQSWAGRIEQLTMRAIARVPVDADSDDRVAALEAAIEFEPWQRSHYDALVIVHNDRHDQAAAAEVERRWFADD